MNLLKTQLYLETKYSKENARKVVMMELEKANFEITYRLHQWIEAVQKWFDEPAGYALMDDAKLLAIDSTSVEALTAFFQEVLVLTLKTVYPMNAQAILGQSIGLLEFDKEISFKYQMKIASELLVLMAIEDVLDLHIGEEEIEDEDGNLMVEHGHWFTCMYELGEDEMAYINQLMYLPPIVCKPRKPVDMYDSGGYFSVQQPLVLNSTLNQHDYPVDMSALEILQQIPFELDEHVLAITETPNKKLDTLKKRKQFKILRDSSRKVYEELQAITDKFYFHWRLDKRGRMYMQGYHVTMQGTEYKKALLTFANKETMYGQNESIA